MTTTEKKKAMGWGSGRKPYRPAIPEENFLSTGLTLLDLALSHGRAGRGVPGGSYVWYVGDSESGKSMMTFQLFAESRLNPKFRKHRLIFDNVEKGVLFDVDQFFGDRVAQDVEPPRGTRQKPVYSETVEEFYDHLDDAVNEGEPFIYVLDSMDSLDAKADKKKFEAEKANRRKGSKAEIAGSYGMAKAKANSTNLKRIVGKLPETGSILVIISQTRDDIGSPIPGSKKASGGTALRFWANVQVWTKVRGAFKKTIKGKERVIGSYIEFAVRKNRINGRKAMKVVAPFHPHNGVGFDDVGACVDFLVEEGKWEAKKNGKGQITNVVAPEFDFDGKREKLIELIEDANEEKELRLLVRQWWKEIDDESALVRKKRY